MSKIYIYTGKIKSGKTTNLFRWCIGKTSIGGVLQPVIDGKRFFYSIRNKELIQLEPFNDFNKDTIQIGKYNFLIKGFNKAKATLIEDFQQDLDWLIIDEFGPLEFDGKGLEPVITEILISKENFKGNLLVVIRENLLDMFLEKYKLKDNYTLFEI